MATASYTQYGGVWNLTSQSQAQGATTWPSPPAPHLYAWGYNAQGQLGLGNTTYYSSPKQVGTLTNWASISAGSSCSAGIKTDGTLWTWGQNTFGALGQNNLTSYSSPKQVGALTNWSQISCGVANLFMLAIKTNGTLWSWGYNGNGQLGLGGSTNYSSPQQVGSLTNWSKISAGGQVSTAIKTDGTLWAWGNAYYGQLGNSTSGNGHSLSSPAQIGSLTNWLFVSAGQYHVLAAKTDGTLWSWGVNGSYDNSSIYGQLGLNNSSNYSSPKQVGSLTNWLNVSAGQYYSSAIKTDGTLWTWGYNNNGQLGLGNTTNYSSPKQVGALTNWSSLTAGRGYFILSIKTDKTLWGWGQNNYGQLGLGNTTNYSSPKQIGLLTTWSNISAGQNHLIGIAKT